jgi:NADH-quinone oxidoreductase subunit C
VTGEEIGQRLVSLVGSGEVGLSVGDGHARPCVDVAREQWVPAATAARDDAQLALTFFDWLTGVDEGEDGYGIVAHLWSVPLRHGLLLRTRVPRGDARLPSLVPVFLGATWHERETFEMFGVVFTGHPDLKKLLLPDEFEGHPLRKDFVLAARVAKSWPGAKEPGESESGAPSRRRMRPPGVPDPNEWGPEAGKAEAAPGERAAGERPPRRTPPGERPARRPPPAADAAPAAGAEPPAGATPQAGATPGEGAGPAEGPASAEGEGVAPAKGDGARAGENAPAKGEGAGPAEGPAPGDSAAERPEQGGEG